MLNYADRGMVKCKGISRIFQYNIREIDIFERNSSQLLDYAIFRNVVCAKAYPVNLDLVWNSTFQLHETGLTAERKLNCNRVMLWDEVKGDE